MTKNTDAKIIQISDAKRIDMYDLGFSNFKAEIIEHIDDFLQK